MPLSHRVSGIPQIVTACNFSFCLSSACPWLVIVLQILQVLEETATLYYGLSICLAGSLRHARKRLRCAAGGLRSHNTKYRPRKYVSSLLNIYCGFTRKFAVTMPQSTFYMQQISAGCHKRGVLLAIFFTT